MNHPKAGTQAEFDDLTLAMPRALPQGRGVVGWERSPTPSGHNRRTTPSDRARFALWCGLFLPFFFSIARTSSDVQSVSFGPLDVIRGAGLLLIIPYAGRILGWRTLRISTIDYFAGAFLIVAVVSAVWSIDPVATALKVVPLVSSYIAIKLLIGSYHTLDVVIRHFSTMIHVLLIFILFQAIAFPSLAFTRASEDDVARLGAVVPEIGANPLAFVCFSGIASIILRVGPRWVIGRATTRNILVVAYLGELFLSRTRSGVVLSLVILGALLLRVLFRRPVSVIATCSIGVASLLGAISYSSIVYEFLIRGQNDQSLETLTGRTDIWRVAVDSIELHPWLGLGFYAGHRIGLTDLPAYGTQSNLDSTWLELLVDIGILGTIPAILFLLFGIWQISSLRVPAGDLTKTFLVGVLAYGLAISFFNPSIQLPGINLLLIVGTIYIASNVERQLPLGSSRITTTVRKRC